MNRKKSPDPSVIIKLGKIFFLTYLSISFIGLIVYMNTREPSPMNFDDTRVIGSWTVMDPDGSVHTEGETYKIDGPSEDTYEMVSVLPDDIIDKSWIFFSTSRNFEVYVDGELREDFDSHRDFSIPGGIVKRFYAIIPADTSDSGKEIRLVTHGTSRLGVVYHEVYVSGGMGLVSFMISNFGLSLIFSEILLIFSFVTTMAGIAMRILYKRKIDMLYGALGVFVISAWMVSDSLLWPFVYRFYHIDGIFNYLMCLLMPFSLALYLNGLQHGRYEKIMSGLIVLSVINAIIWPGLHFTGILPFPYALLYINIILGIQVVIVLGVLFVDIARRLAREYLYTAVGFVGFLICCFVELLFLNLVVTKQDANPMMVGLAFLLTLSVVQQIHDLKNMREEGQKAMEISEAKTRFLASMSHEIRTPINAILGMNEMIIRENRDPVIGDYARSVKSSGRMLLMLVNDVLDFSKIEAGKMEIAHAGYRLSALLRDIYPMLRERSDEKNLFFNVSILNQVPNGQISDEFRIRQILINLINNAIKYTDKGSVTLEIGGEYTSPECFNLRFVVKDTGRGIKEEDRETLFDAFARADMSRNRSIEGTGLGLSIVKSIVDSMEGTIDVDSTYGKGSAFTVTIPVVVCDRSILKADFLSDTESAEGSSDACDFIAPGAKILAVDDNISNLRIVTLLLKRAQIVPDTCDGGLRALEMCREKKYDLILLDHMMPDPDGMETLKAIRSDSGSLNSDTTVIVLTANAVAGSRKMYLDAGFADYLTKPIDADLLEEMVRKYIPAHKLLMPGDDVRSGAGSVPEDDRPDEADNEEELSDIEEKLSKIEGLDFDAAMQYAGDNEEILARVVESISEGSGKMIASLRADLSDEDYDAYRRDAHSVKGLMATIGLGGLSERARKHEFAARDGDIEFIKKDCDGFIEEYRTVCEKIR